MPAGFRCVLISVCVLLGLPGLAAAEMAHNWVYGSTNASKVLKVEIDWYKYNDFGHLIAGSGGYLRVHRGPDELEISISAGGGRVCSETRQRAGVMVAFETDDPVREAWEILEDRESFSPVDDEVFLTRLLTDRTVAFDLSDDCGWPWRAEIWLQEGHHLLEKLRR